MVDPLLRGAIDLHWHGYPEISFAVRTRLEDVAVLEAAWEAGMRGVVLKSHLWPTVGRVYHLRERVPGIEVYASITLNVSAGGISPWAVEAAAQQGAKVVFMPTWSAANDIAQAGFSARMRRWFPSLEGSVALQGLRATDASGQVLPEVREIIEIARDGGLMLSTGHLSPEESLAMAAEAERLGFERLVMGHPLSRSIGATLEQMQEMTRRGASIEFVALGAFNPNPARRAPTERVAEAIAALGVEHCVLATDSFLDWPPPLPEFLRMFLMSLREIGVGEEDLRRMVRDNPARLLGLPPQQEEST